MPRSQNKSLPKARASRADATPGGFYAGRCSMKFPKAMSEFWAGQNSVEKGASWLAGVQLEQEMALLHMAIAKLAGCELPSFIVENSGVTLVMGQYSVTGETQVEALLKLYREVMFSEDGSVQQEPEKESCVLDTVPLPCGGYTSAIPLPEESQDSET